LSVNRTVSAQTDVRIMNIIGLQYNIISWNLKYLHK
jgi:hypothetical protein